MKIKIGKKKITLDDLALMVGKGFNDISSRMATKEDIKKLDFKIDSVEKNLKQEIQGLRSSVNNYLKLSDKRYLELRHNQKILAKYIKIVIQKSKFPVDIQELETVLK